MYDIDDSIIDNAKRNTDKEIGRNCETSSIHAYTPSYKKIKTFYSEKPISYFVQHRLDNELERNVNDWLTANKIEECTIESNFVTANQNIIQCVIVTYTNIARVKK